jgi:predicted nucleotidyltransferase
MENIQTRIIEIVSEAARLRNIDFLLIGAYARNIFLKNKPDVPIPRYTYDVDVACQVKDWSEYHALLEILIDKYAFKNDARKRHRLLFGKDNAPLDVIPFGGIENEDGEIFWPPDFDACINVRGFRAALFSADEVEIGKTSVKVIKPSLFALLKLVSYLEDNSRTKDLKDFYFMASQYFDIIDANSRIYADNAPDADILEKDEFDWTVAGAELIGRDCIAIDRQFSKEAADLIHKYERNKDSALIIALSQTCALSPEYSRKIIFRMLDELLSDS